jgi:hypothetical protein
MGEGKGLQSCGTDQQKMCRSITRNTCFTHHLFYTFLCLNPVCHYIPLSLRFVLFDWSRDSSVCIAARYELDGPGSNPGGGEIFWTRPDRL